MTTPERRRLEALLSQRMASIVDRAVRSGGDIAQDELDALRRLEHLIELSSSTRTGIPRRIWALAALLAATLAVVSLLLFARVRTTEVELDIEANEISFSLPSQQVLIDNLALSSLGVAGLERIELPDPIASAVIDGDAAIRLEAVSAGSRAGVISIASLVPGADTDVWLRRTDDGERYRLSLRDPRLTVQVDAVGPVRVSVAGLPSRVVDFTAPRAITLDPGDGIVDFDLEFANPAAASLTPQVPVRNVAFFRVDEFADREISIVRRLSTIQSGTLYLESLNGTARTLRAGETLRFAGAEGEIRSARLDATGLKVNFHGWVRGMQTGSEDSPRSLMPTWLEWVQARHAVTLLWGTTIYVFGVLVGVARSLRLPI